MLNSLATRKPDDISSIRQHVLIVEDDRSQARLIELIFAHSEFPVDLSLAHSLAEAKALLATGSFDLVITDLNLPDGRGVDLLPADRSRMAYPIMLLTGQGDELVAVQAIKSGAVDYIVKTDASIKALPHTVARILREWGNVLLRREMEETLQQKQQELEENHLQLKSLFEQVSLGKREWELTFDCVSDLIIRIDEQNRIRRANRAVLELTRRTFPELVGMDISEVLDGLKLGKTELRNVEVHHGPTGRVFMLSSYRLEPGEVGAGMVIAAHDYTAISELNARLSESNQELARKSNELELAYVELEQTQVKVLRQEKMATVGQLAAGIAHEINNPMGFILSNLGTLGKYLSKITEYMTTQDELFSQIVSPAQFEVLAAKRRENKIDYILGDLNDLVKESLEGAERVRKIVSDLKGFSHQTKDADELTDINQLIEGTIPIVWNEIKYKATLKRDYAELPKIYCRHRLLSQVLINLLVNAVHAIEKQGVISLKTWQDGESVNISVSDTGTGITDEVAKRIFDPFFTTKEIGVGTGLGLSISYDIIKQHDGELLVDSVVGEGSTFTIRLPVLQSSGEAVAAQNVATFE